MKIYCCEDHVELALDIWVDEVNTPPIIEKSIYPQIKCEHCFKNSQYVVFEKEN